MPAAYTASLASHARESIVLSTALQPKFVRFFRVVFTVFSQCFHSFFSMFSQFFFKVLKKGGDPARMGRLAMQAVL